MKAHILSLVPVDFLSFRTQLAPSHGEGPLGYLAAKRDRARGTLVPASIARGLRCTPERGIFAHDFAHARRGPCGHNLVSVIIDM